MDKKEIDEIGGECYSWITIKRGPIEQEPQNPFLDWKDEYFTLLEHHKEETNFLINKCRVLAKELNG